MTNTWIVSYNDGKPTDTFTNAGPVAYLGSGSFVRIQGTRNGVQVDATIPTRRIAEIDAG